MTLGLPSPSIRALLCVASVVSTLTVIEPATAYLQNAAPQQNTCRTSDNLKATKMVNGDYTEEAAKKNVEGTVALCLTVDRNGGVTDVNALSGPTELFQPSIDAARQWQFEPPSKAPAAIKIEMRYSLTKPCPEGKGWDAGDVVVTMVPTNDEKGGELKIVGKLSQPQPPYPEEARAERRRGQLYLSVIVNPDGSVTDVRIVKPLDELLDKPAVETVRTWRFKVSGGKPTSFSVTLSFRIPCLDR